MIAAGIMGLPPTVGIVLQSPMHTHALSVRCDCFIFFYFILFFLRPRKRSGFEAYDGSSKGQKKLSRFSFRSL